VTALAGPALDDHRLLAFLQDIVRIDSTTEHEDAAVARIADEMTRLGFDESVVDGAGNAVGRIGSGSPVLLIDCHVDTIPVHSEKAWKHPPFAAELDGDRLYGLGVCDMKASAAAAVYGVARLKHQGALTRGTVYVVSSICEEMMEGAALAPTVERCAPDLVIIGEPSDLKLCVGQRGRAKMEVVVSGRSSHAGHPEVGLNAAELMAEYIGAAAALRHPRDEKLGPRILTCIDVHSEPYPSVSQVPNTCVARFDCRFGRGETQDSLLEMLRSLGSVWDRRSEKPGLDCHPYLTEFVAHGVKFAEPEFAAAWYTEPGSEIVTRSLAGLRDAGIEPVMSTYGFCTNGSLTAGIKGIPTVGFGIGKEEVAHTVDEWVSVENFYRGTRGYTALAQHLLAR